MTNEINCEEIAKRLRELREKKHMSQDTVSKRLGYSRGSIITDEKGEVFPPIQRLEAYITLYNISWEYLLLGITPESISRCIHLSRKVPDEMQPYFLDSIEATATAFSRMSIELNSKKVF